MRSDLPVLPVPGPSWSRTWSRLKGTSCPQGQRLHRLARFKASDTAAKWSTYRQLRRTGGLGEAAPGASALLHLTNFLAVAAEQHLLDELAGNEWRTAVALPMLEVMRGKARGLVRLNRQRGRPLLGAVCSCSLGRPEGIFSNADVDTLVAILNQVRGTAVANADVA